MNDREWPDDVDWDSPACVEGCPCPLCQQADRDEAALFARLDSTDPDLIDLSALAIASKRPWREGDAA